MKKNKESKIQIRVAIVGLIGVIVAAIITARCSRAPQNDDASSKTNTIIEQSVGGDQSNVINNNSGEINIDK